MKNVIVYSTSYCPYCMKAKNLLKSKNIPFKEVDLTDDSDKRRQLEEQTGWMTVPMIFIEEEFIGGADALFELDKSGQLQKKLGA